MKFIIYERSMDPKGNASWLKVGEAETWRETHQFRRLRKSQRIRDGLSVSTFVYDDRGHFLCTP